MGGYKPFILSFNHALRALRKIKVQPLRGSTDLQPLFHRNDPKTMMGMHNGRTSLRKPDIILVSLADARATISDDDQGMWADFAFKTAGDPPQKDFWWRNSLSVAEFKRTRSDLTLPPTEYILKPVEKIEPVNFSNDGEVNDVPAQEEVTQFSVEAKPKSSNRASISGKPPRRRLNSF